MEKKILGMKIENRVNLGDILTMVGMLAAMALISFGVWRELYDITSSNERRITINEQLVAAIKDQTDRDRRYIREDLRDIKVLVREVSSKMDKKADK